ncbi:MAG: arylsulfotransferase family protein [Solirubrobacteraceae bacterium]
MADDVLHVQVPGPVLGVTPFVPIDRRAFLAGALKTGVGVGLGSKALRHPGRRRTPRDANPVVVSSEPSPPPSAVEYVTRPDLTPVGVAIRSSPSFGVSAQASGYIFCAPKSPHFASPPGSGGPPQAVFPDGADPGLMIFDTSGELVWFKPLRGPDQIPFNFRVQSYQGRRVLTWFQGQVHAAHGMGHYVLADATYTAFAQVHSTEYPCDLHEFLVTDLGTALHTAYESRVRPGQVPMFIGHAQEVDIATNDLLFDWSSYPEVATSLSYVTDNPHYFDYFHINSIDLWPGAARNLLISSRNTSAVYLVDRSSSSVSWRLGGKRSDFALGPGARFYFQHDARALSDGSGMSLFDDASQPAPEAFASGKVLTLDQAAKTASLQRQFIHTDGEFVTPSQGNLQLLPNGGHVVGWGYYPFFSAYAPTASLEAPLVLDGRFPAGAASYRTYLFDWVGNPPPHELRLVVQETTAPGRVRVFVSWNGATEVASWQLHAGRNAHSLQSVATFPKGGFETVLNAVTTSARYFQVAALNGAGAVLGSSAIVSASPATGAAPSARRRHRHTR